MSIKNNKICVLGAAGAIGSHLVTSLHKQGYEVTAVIRSWSSAVRIGRYQIKLVSMDLLKTSVDDLSDVVAGHDIVIDCTYSKNTDYQSRIDESRQLAQLICNAALKAKVKQVIHYGTISVYPAEGGCVNETTVCQNSGDSYGDSKLAAEQVFLQSHSHELAITVLQLPIVFGPFMGWTTEPISQMLAQELLIPDDLKGHCAPLFVDDVVKGTVLAFNCSAAFGQRILLSDKNMSWHDYYSAYADLSSSLQIASITRDEYNQRDGIQKRSIKPFQNLKQKFMDDGEFRQLVLAQWGVRSLYGLVKRLRGQNGVDAIKQKIASTVQSNNECKQVLLNSQTVELFDSLPKVDPSKASEILGFDQYTDFSIALSTTKDWLKWARLLN